MPAELSSTEQIFTETSRLVPLSFTGIVYWLSLVRPKSLVIVLFLKDWDLKFIVGYD